MSNCTPSVLLTPISMLSKSMKTAIFSRVSAKTFCFPFLTAASIAARPSRPSLHYGPKGLGLQRGTHVVRVDTVLIADEELSVRYDGMAPRGGIAGLNVEAAVLAITGRIRFRQAY